MDCYRTSDAAALSHRLAAAEAAHRDARESAIAHAEKMMMTIPVAPMCVVVLWVVGGRPLAIAGVVAMLLVILRAEYLDRRADRLEAAYFDALAKGTP
jgi:hypothetical protein